MVAATAAGEALALPGGLILDDREPIVDARLRALTGQEEDWLASHPSVPNAVAVSYLLSHCVMRLGGMEPAGEMVRKLLVGDRDYLMLQLRRLTLGERFDAVLQCPECSSKMDVTFQAGDIEIEPRPQRSHSYLLDLPEDSAGPSRTVRFRLPTGADQEAVLNVPPEKAVEALLSRCLLDDGGRPLAPQEQFALSGAMEQEAPQVDLELDLNCPECAHAFTAPLDLNSFFFDEMRVRSSQMLREVHMLALYYHWSEAEILALGRERRRAYLSLLADDFRED
jgi:hypothetical protein